MEYLPKIFLLMEPEYWGVDDFFCQNMSLAGSKEAVEEARQMMFDSFKRAIEVLRNSQSDEVRVEMLSFFDSLEFRGYPWPPTDLKELVQ